MLKEQLNLAVLTAQLQSSKKKKARDASYSAEAEYTRTTRIVSNQNVQELSTEKNSRISLEERDDSANSRARSS